MSDENLGSKLPEMLREVRYYNETIDYVVLFNDQTAAASLSTEEPWIKELIQALQANAAADAIANVQKAIKNLITRSKQLMKERDKVDAITVDDYRSLMDCREALFEAITEASPAKSGGVAAQVIHEYRTWSHALVVNYYFNPNNTTLDADHDLARDRLMRWLDEVPMSVKNKVNVSLILEADEDLFKTARMRIQERMAGRVANDATYENIATIRERLLDRLVELQIEVSEHSVSADSPLVIGGRRRLEADLHAEMARFVRHQDQIFTLVICVIDKIKAMRDKLGAEAVDSVLRQAAGVLAETLRPYDKVYTAGGGKIAMMLPNSPAEGGFEAARRCQTTLLNTKFSIPSGRKIQLTASFGLSESAPDEDWQTLYDAAYKALTAAKSKGNNKCCAKIGDDLIFDDDEE